MALPSAHPLTPRHATPWQKRVTLIRKTHTEAPLHGRGLGSYSMLPENQELTVLFGLCVVPASAANGPSHFLIRMLPELYAEDSRIQQPSNRKPEKAGFSGQKEAKPLAHPGMPRQTIGLLRPSRLPSH